MLHCCRMDEALYFDLPGEAERVQILAVYLDAYLLKAGSSQGKLPRIALGWPSSCTCSTAAGLRVQQA